MTAGKQGAYTWYEKLGHNHPMYMANVQICRDVRKSLKSSLKSLGASLKLLRASRKSSFESFRSSLSQVASPLRQVPSQVSSRYPD